MSEEQMSQEMFDVGRMMRRGIPENQWTGSEQNQQIVQAIREVFEDGRPVDLVIVAEQLRKKGLLEAVGSYQYLTECWEVAGE